MTVKCSRLVWGPKEAWRLMLNFLGSPKMQTKPMQDYFTTLSSLQHYLVEQRRQLEALTPSWRSALETALQQQTAPLRRVLSEFETSQRALTSATLSMTLTEAVEAAQIAFNRIQPPQLEQPAVQSALATARQAFEQLNSISKRFQPYATALSAISEQLQVASRSLEETLRFEQSFGGQLLKRLASLEKTESEEEFRDSAGQLVQEVEDQSQRLPQTRVARIGLLLTVLAILISIYSIIDQKGEQARLNRYFLRIDEQLTNLGDRLAQEVVDDDEAADIEAPRCYLTKGSVPLREGPSAQHDITRRLHPQTLVEVVSRDGNWLEVEIYDFAEMQTDQGWVYKRHLSALDVSESIISHTAEELETEELETRGRLQLLALLGAVKDASLSVAELESAGISRQRLKELRDQNYLLGIQLPFQRGFLYPRWQFEDDLTPKAFLPRVLEVADEAGLDALTVHQILTNPAAGGGVTPLQLCEDGRIETTLDILRAFGESGG